MKRSELATKFRAEPNDLNKKVIKKQRNFCKLPIIKNFRKRYDHFYPTKLKVTLKELSKSTQKICLEEGGRIVSDSTEVANISNKHYSDSVRSLAEAECCGQQILDYN